MRAQNLIISEIVQNKKIVTYKAWFPYDRHDRRDRRK